VDFEPGTLAIITNVLTNFAERTDYIKPHRTSRRCVSHHAI